MRSRFGLLAGAATFSACLCAPVAAEEDRTEIFRTRVDVSETSAVLQFDQCESTVDSDGQSNSEAPYCLAFTFECSARSVDGERSAEAKIVIPEADGTGLTSAKILEALTVNDLNMELSMSSGPVSGITSVAYFTVEPSGDISNMITIAADPTRVLQSLIKTQPSQIMIELAGQSINLIPDGDLTNITKFTQRCAKLIPNQ